VVSRAPAEKPIHAYLKDPRPFGCPIDNHRYKQPRRFLQVGWERFSFVKGEGCSCSGAVPSWQELEQVLGRIHQAGKIIECLRRPGKSVFQLQSSNSLLCQLPPLTSQPSFPIGQPTENRLPVATMTGCSIPFAGSGKERSKCCGYGDVSWHRITPLSKQVLWAGCLPYPAISSRLLFGSRVFERE